MTSHLIPLRPVALAAICGLLSGCIGSGARRDEMIVRKPAMPTMAPAPASAQTNVVDDETFAKAFDRARNNDVFGAVATLRSVHDAAQRDRLTTRLVDALAMENPRTAVAFGMALPRGAAQTAAIETAARAMVNRDADAAVRWAMDLADPTAARLARRVVAGETVRINPRAAIERVQALPVGRARNDMLVMTAAAWARVDPDAVISWLRGQPDDAVKPRLTSGVGFEMAQTRPDRAVEVAEMLPEGRDRWLLFSAIAQTWVAKDAAAAQAWASRLPAGEARAAALAGFDTGQGVPVSRRIARAPGVRSGSRVRGGSGAATSVEINSPAFTAWLATQPPGISREEAILEYIRQRGSVEPLAVGAWISGLPLGPTRERAMQIHLDNLLVASPTEAARLLYSLPASDRSNDLVEKTARELLRTNPDSAKLWMDQMMLPSDRKEQLLREVGR
jgi:hypothetical protein